MSMSMLLFTLRIPVLRTGYTRGAPRCFFFGMTSSASSQTPRVDDEGLKDGFL